MIEVASSHGPGIVGIAAGELARYTAFTASFSGLAAPAGTLIVIAASYDVAYNRNDCIRTMLEHPEAQWVQLWDDDHTFESDTLLRLLDREADVVVPLYTQRQPPFFPCVFKEECEDGSFRVCKWEDLEGRSGLMPVISAGAGGVLIRRHVIEALSKRDPREKPEWFERQGKTGEDHLFYKKCREAGFVVSVDLDVHLGHLTPVEVRPFRNDAGQWCGRVDLKRNVTVECWSNSYQGGKGTLGAAAVNAV
mgnify:CR=1 FL=1